MLKKLRSMYRSGRTGQPMPARADRSVGEVAIHTATVVAVFSATMFAMGVAGRLIEPLTLSRDDRETRSLRNRIRIKELQNDLAG